MRNPDSLGSFLKNDSVTHLTYKSAEAEWEIITTLKYNICFSVGVQKQFAFFLYYQFNY